jgi:hypothetical protein
LCCRSLSRRRGEIVDLRFEVSDSLARGVYGDRLRFIGSTDLSVVLEHQSFKLRRIFREPVEGATHTMLRSHPRDGHFVRALAALGNGAAIERLPLDLEPDRKARATRRASQQTGEQILLFFVGDMACRVVASIALETNANPLEQRFVDERLDEVRDVYPFTRRRLYPTALASGLSAFALSR